MPAFIAKAKQVKSEFKKTTLTPNMKIKNDKTSTGSELKTTISRKRKKLSLSMVMMSLILFIKLQSHKQSSPPYSVAQYKQKF
jgi:hypothetical protein